MATSSQIEIYLGQRIAGLRLSRNITQRDLALAAGVSLSTMRRLEAGGGVSLDTFVRVLIGLGIQGNLATLIPDSAVRPVDRVKHKGKQRRRARHSRNSEGTAGEWSWNPKG